MNLFTSRFRLRMGKNLDFTSYSWRHLLGALLSFSAILVSPNIGFGAPVETLSLPPGFSVVPVASKLTGPTHIAFAPDGRIFVSLKAGQIKVIKNGAVLPTPFLSVDTDAAGEHGLIGVEFDPAFAQNSYVYVYYVAKTPNIHGRVSRFTANGDTALPDSELIIAELEGRGTSVYHVAGGLRFGTDGKLYISSGDNAGVPNATNSQLLTNTFGKILRINSDGTIPSDNPFFEQRAAIPSIYAYGFRNPFSFSMSRISGKTYVNEVGGTLWEEIDELTRGGNYGWPLAEGMSSNSNFVNPTFTYPHGEQTDETAGCAITGGDFYEPLVPQFPDTYFGKYFFMDYCNNWIRIFDPNTGTASSFAGGITSSGLGLKTGPDGSIYYLSAWFNTLYKISFSGNQFPTFLSQPSPQTVTVGQSAVFQVVASGTSITYQWRKNGIPVVGANSNTLTLPNVAASDDGTSIDCVISNSFGSITSKTVVLRVVAAPTPASLTVDYPDDGARYSGGDRIYYGGTAQDSNGSALPASAFTLNVYFHHNNHIHPFISNLQGKNAGYFDIPKVGEPSPNTWFRLVLSVTNSQNAETSVTRVLYPNLSTVFLKSNPPGLQITLDGSPLTTPTYEVGVVGFSRTLGVISPQTYNGISYEFDSWSDGKPDTHLFSTSVSTRTYTANFRPVGSANRGKLTASPNPAQVCDGSTAGSTTLFWETSGVQDVEIRINAPNGNLLKASNSAQGAVTTQKWIGSGSTFYLQDRTGGLPLTAENTLATVTVDLTRYGCDALLSSR